MKYSAARNMKTLELVKCPSGMKRAWRMRSGILRFMLPKATLHISCHEVTLHYSHHFALELKDFRAFSNEVFRCAEYEDS
jgi:hypothetical protein